MPKRPTIMQWAQEKPSWCPHQDCRFVRRAQDSLCGGELPERAEHNGDFNTHRMCLREAERTDAYQVNKTDLEWFRWVFDALDGKETSWLSKRDQAPEKAG